MNRGLMIKAAREVWPTTLLIGLALLIVETALAYVMPIFQQRLATQMAQFSFMQSVVKAIAGVDVSGGAGPEVFGTLPWLHPVVLSLVWAHAVILCTRVPAGEVDRGTVDVMLSWPVSRWGVFVSETAVWIGSAALVLAMALAGNTLGGRLGGAADLRPSPGRLAILLVNLFLMYAAVGAGAWLMSALSDRRGKAMTVVFIAVLASFLINYLAQLWSPAERVWFLSVLRYYQPVVALRSGTWPWADVAVLGSVAGGLWIGAGVVFARRDLCTT